MINKVRTYHCFIAFLTILFCCFTTDSQAADLYVSVTGSDAGAGTTISPWKTISYAVSKANDGDVIHIGAGNYAEQVIVAKNISLIGEGISQTKIISPAVLSTSFYAGTTYFPVVYFHDVNAASIKNLTVDGDNRLTDVGASFTGVAYLNAGGIVDNCSIINIMTTPAYVSDNGIGLFAYSESNIARQLTISNTKFAAFQKMAAGFWGKDLTANFDRNTIEGAGMITAIAQNGVQYSQQTAGTITKNIIKDINYAAYDQSSTAILVNDARQAITIQENNILDCQTGIYCINSTASIVLRNKLVFSAANYSADINYWWGILVRNGSYTIKENEIDGGGSGTGIDGFSYANENTFITATNNALKNLETGISTEVEETPACAGGLIQYNSITNTLEPLFNNQEHTAECPVPNAPCNWYGSANIEDFTNEAEGKGHIIGKYNYEPWLTSGTDAQPNVAGFQPLPDACNGKPCKDLADAPGLKESFPNSFNTSLYQSLVNRTFSGSSGTWTAFSSENASVAAVKPYYLPSSTQALKLVHFNTYNCGGSWSKAVSPQLSLAGACCPDHVKFNFTLWTYSVACNDVKAKLEIDFSADNGVTWTEVYSKTSHQLWSQFGASGKGQVSIAVPQAFQNSNFRYRIRGEMASADYNNFYVFIDDIYFTSPAICASLGSIGDFVWKDINSNGRQDAGEPGIANVSVKLVMPNGTSVTKTTDASGKYLFTGLASGNYTVRFATPAGLEPTQANVVTDDEIDSDPINGSVLVSLAESQNIRSIDAGFKVPVCTNTLNHLETFPNKFNTYITTSLYNKTFTGSAGTWVVNSNNRAAMAVLTPYYAPSSSYALKVVNFNTNGCGSGWTKAVSPKVDLSAPCCPSELKMSFTLWTYKVVANDVKAKLEIDFSSNNGATWTEVWSKSSAQLYTNYGAGGKVTINIAVPQAFQNSNFRYRIRGEMASGDCNNFYVFIDDIKIASPASCSSAAIYTSNYRTAETQGKVGETATKVEAEGLRGKILSDEENMETALDFSVNVFPNPSPNGFELQLRSSETEMVNLQIMDMTGRVVKTLTLTPDASLRFGSELKPGTYLLKAWQGEKARVIKLVKL